MTVCSMETGNGNRSRAQEKERQEWDTGRISVGIYRDDRLVPVITLVIHLVQKNGMAQCV